MDHTMSRNGIRKNCSRSGLSVETEEVDDQSFITGQKTSPSVMRVRSHRGVGDPSSTWYTQHPRRDSISEESEDEFDIDFMRRCAKRRRNINLSNVCHNQSSQGDSDVEETKDDGGIGEVINGATENDGETKDGTENVVQVQSRSNDDCPECSLSFPSFK